MELKTGGASRLEAQVGLEPEIVSTLYELGPRFRGDKGRVGFNEARLFVVYILV